MVSDDEVELRGERLADVDLVDGRGACDPTRNDTRAIDDGAEPAVDRFGDRLELWELGKLFGASA
jgi:hypothetical protein